MPDARGPWTRARAAIGRDTYPRTRDSTSSPRRRVHVRAALPHDRGRAPGCRARCPRRAVTERRGRGLEEVLLVDMAPLVVRDHVLVGVSPATSTPWPGMVEVDRSGERKTMDFLQHAAPGTPIRRAAAPRGQMWMRHLTILSEVSFRSAPAPERRRSRSGAPGETAGPARIGRP